MTEINSGESGLEIESRKLHTLVDKYQETLGPFEIVPVGEAGFVVQRQQRTPMAGNDWFFFDYDDTMRATSEVKEQRLDLYKQAAQKMGIVVSEGRLKTVMDVTDKFSRWEDTPGGGDTYHVNAHTTALDWATRELQQFSRQTERSMTEEELVANIESRLNRIKSELTDESLAQEDDPFYIRQSDKKLINKSKVPWSPELEEIFMKTMVNPPQYEEAVQAAITLGQPYDSIHRTNIGAFTFGAPPFQLHKVLELMEQNPNLEISQIWLTKVPKGKFILELVKSGALDKLPLEYVPATLEEDAFEGISHPSGHPLGLHGHTFVMMDDSKKEAESILSANPYLEEHTGAQFSVVRSRRANTKEGEKDWEIDTPYGEIDFRTNKFSSHDVATILQINRYLSYRNKFGATSSKVQNLAEVLKQMGIEHPEELAA